jgi:hypothetical protein
VACRLLSGTILSLRLRPTGLAYGILTRHACRDRRPEPSPLISSCHRRGSEWRFRMFIATSSVKMLQWPLESAADICGLTLQCTQFDWERSLTAAMVHCMEQLPEKISRENVARLDEIEAAQQEMAKLLNDAENL